MGVVLALLISGAGLMFGAPVVVRRVPWVRRPGLALWLWCGSHLLGLAGVAASLVVALWVAMVDDRSGPPEQSGALTATSVVVFCWVGLVSVGALGSLVLSRSEPLTAEQRHHGLIMTLLARTSTYRRQVVGRVTVLFVRDERPVAVSLPGSRPRVMVTSRLEEELTAGQLRAVIEHECAHLTRRHGWIVQLARLNAACLPALPSARRFEQATRLLVELIADDVAARRCGREDLVQALQRLGALTGDDGMLLRAHRVTTLAAGGSRTSMTGSGLVVMMSRRLRLAPEAEANEGGAGRADWWRRARQGPPR